MHFFAGAKKAPEHSFGMLLGSSSVLSTLTSLGAPREVFMSLGDFAERKMLYVCTCNEDRWTSASQVTPAEFSRN